jgi:ribose-phosphate pyrophosphokinase
MAMPGNDALAGVLAARLGFELGAVEVRHFPDGESYVRLLPSPEGRAVVIACTLDHSNDKLLPLLFAAAAARDLKASQVGLVSLYLAYVRQHRVVQTQQGITS